jgi:hypothetical protein
VWIILVLEVVDVAQIWLQTKIIYNARLRLPLRLNLNKSGHRSRDKKKIDFRAAKLWLRRKSNKNYKSTKKSLNCRRE